MPLAAVGDSFRSFFDAVLRLKLARKRVRKIAAALDNGRKPKVSVTAKATDAAGNVVTDSLTVRARRSR